MKFKLWVVAILACAQSAFADVDASEVGFFRSWHVGMSVEEVVRSIGAPDFVTLPTDHGDIAGELRENGIAKELAWRVPGCSPVRIQVDSAGRTIGVDYSSLLNSQTFCTPFMASMMTPAQSFSCTRTERAVHCR